MKNFITHLSSLLLLALVTNSQAAVTYSAGHADIGLEYGGPGTLAFHAHVHTGATVDGVPLIADDEYEPDDIVIAVSTSAFHTQNNNNDLVAGTGVIVGNGIWRLPESNNPILPFIGFGAEELTAADWSGNLTITLASIISPSGNGHFSVYQSDGLGGWNFFMSTAVGGITSADKVEIAAEGHDHFNMTFSEAGNWIVNLFASGTHATDGLQTSNTYSFSFAVAPEPSRALLSLIGFSMLCLRRRRA